MFFLLRFSANGQKWMNRFQTCLGASPIYHTIWGQLPREGEEQRHLIWGPTFDKIPCLRTQWMRRYIDYAWRNIHGKVSIIGGYLPLRWMWWFHRKVSSLWISDLDIGHSYECDRMGMDIHTLSVWCSLCKKARRRYIVRIATLRSTIQSLRTIDSSATVMLLPLSDILARRSSSLALLIPHLPLHPRQWRCNFASALWLASKRLIFARIAYCVWKRRTFSSLRSLLVAHNPFPELLEVHCCVPALTCFLIWPLQPLIFDHHIPWNPHLETWENNGDVDGLNMAMRAKLMLFVAQSLRCLWVVERHTFLASVVPKRTSHIPRFNVSPNVSFLYVPPLLIR